MSNWLTRPSLSRLQFLILFAGMLYFLYMNTKFFQDLPDLIQFLIYSAVLITSAFLGYSFIDSKRFAAKLNQIWRNPRMEQAEKYEKCFELVDEILFHIESEMKQKNKKTKKKGDK